MSDIFEPGGLQEAGPVPLLESWPALALEQGGGAPPCLPWAASGPPLLRPAVLALYKATCDGPQYTHVRNIIGPVIRGEGRLVWAAIVTALGGD